jgi:hypothetical protein
MDLVKRGPDLEYDIVSLSDHIRQDKEGDMKKLSINDIDDLLSICHASRSNLEQIITFLNTRKKYMEENGYANPIGPKNTLRHYGVTVDLSKPTIGVFQNNHCEWLYEDAYEGHDIDFIGHMEECEEDEYDNRYGYSQNFLIGFKTVHEKDGAWLWFPNQKIGFIPDTEAEYSAIVGEIYTQVVRSKWGINCNLCSPCYPGQGDADTPGNVLSYSLPPDVVGFEDTLEDSEENKLKSRIFALNETYLKNLKD